MKTSITKFSLILSSLFLILPVSCRTRNLEALRSRLSASHNTNNTTSARQNETYKGRQVILFKDSADHQYSVKIFPLDTFSFSPEKGFSGRAASIELSGTVRSKQETANLSDISSERRSEFANEEVSKWQTKQKEVSRILEKRSWSIVSLLIVVAIVLFILIAFRRLGQLIQLKR